MDLGFDCIENHMPTQLEAVGQEGGFGSKGSDYELRLTHKRIVITSDLIARLVHAQDPNWNEVKAWTEENLKSIDEARQLTDGWKTELMRLRKSRNGEDGSSFN